MTKRALFVFDWDHITNQYLTFIQKKSEQFDELIFLIDKADQKVHCGQMLLHLRSTFNPCLKIPFYILPLLQRGLSDIAYWLRWRILCPSFERVYIDQASMQQPLQSILRQPVEIFTQPEEFHILNFSSQNCSRGLFISRLQPFHVGHAEILQRMSQMVEEILIIIAMGNKSHEFNNIATGGERLAMINGYMHASFPQRYHLVALPYSHYSMENFYELEYLLPPFQSVHTNNPQVAAMAHTAGYPVISHSIQKKISSTIIREQIAKGEDYAPNVPANTYQFLQESEIPMRLRQLHTKENRE